MDIELLTRFVTGETNAEEYLAVERWCAADQANREQLKQLQEIWELSGLNHEMSLENTQDSLKRFKQKQAAIAPKIESKSKILRLSFLSKVAAIFIGIPMIVWFFVIHSRSASEVVMNTANQVTSTTLADGSAIVLNRNSKFIYPKVFSADKRIVQLVQGEAFFKVSHNAKKPFYILANGVEIKVLGTSFNVKLKGKQTEVIVESGKVQVSKNARRILLRPQESVLVNEGDHELFKSKLADKLYTYYRTGDFVAIGTPLYKFAQVLEEAFDVKISFESEQLKQLKISTRIKKESLDEILNVIAKTFNLEIERKGQNVKIKKPAN